MGNHGHSHMPQNGSGKNLLWATLLNFTITIAEVIGGLLSNSLALLSDALHNLGDTFAVLLAYVASRISRKESSEHRTFGYKRIEILAALFNAAILVIICIYLFFEAYKRFLDPSPIKGGIMLIVASVGLIANFVAAILLHSGSSQNINIRAAYLHLLGDTLSSVAVVIGGVLILFYDVYWVDPLITVIVGVYILWEAGKIIRESVSILMQSAPRGINLNTIKQNIEAIQFVKNLHHVHIWRLDDRQVHFEGHVEIERDLHVSQTNTIRSQIETMLDKFGIQHVTLQFELDCCDDKSVINKEGIT